MRTRLVVGVETLYLAAFASGNAIKVEYRSTKIVLHAVSEKPWARMLLFLTEAGEPPNGCPNFRWRLRRPDQSESPLLVIKEYEETSRRVAWSEKGFNVPWAWSDGHHDRGE